MSCVQDNAGVLKSSYSPVEPDELLAQKPKIGRPRSNTPITPEVRKQRNREAQKAFKNRQYRQSVQLENNIKRKDQMLAELQEEVTGLRMYKYRSSLLERILQEKGKSASQSVLQILIKSCRHWCWDRDWKSAARAIYFVNWFKTRWGSFKICFSTAIGLSNSHKATPLAGLISPYSSLYVIYSKSCIDQDRLNTEEEYLQDACANIINDQEGATINDQDSGDRLAGPPLYLDQPTFSRVTALYLYDSGMPSYTPMNQMLEIRGIYYPN